MAPLFVTCRHRPCASFAMALSGNYVAARNVRPMAPSPRRRPTAARWSMQRHRGQCFIQVEAAVVDRIRAMRRPSESYRDVILRLVELEAGRRWA